MIWIALLLSAAVVFAGWRAPISGRRRIAVTLLRLAAIWVIVASLRTGATPTSQEQPRHIAYLVDRSASIDARQAAWIEKRIASLEAIRPKRLIRSVLAFGQRAATVVPEGDGRLDADAVHRALTGANIDPSRTNLEGALLAALSSLPSQAHSRVIILTDGRETTGSVEQMLSHGRRLGLEIYPVPVPSAAPQTMAWEQLVVPSSAKRGETVPVQVVVRNGTTAPQPVDVTISVRGVAIAHQRAAVKPGWHVVTVGVPAVRAGTMQFDVAVQFARSSAREQRSSFVEVEGPPRVLVVLERPTQLPLLAQALKRREMDLAVTTPAELPVDAQRLLDYDAVLLSNIPKSAVSQAQAAALRTYTERLGGGIVMVGLGGKLDEEIAHEAPLDALLPVRFEPKGVQEAKRRLCIILLIDRSASMLGPRIAATKRAAVELVRQLQPEDLVGVMAFDTIAYIIIDVQPAAAVGPSLVDKLARLKSTGGTDIYPALKAAQERLQATDSTVKHIILLSDGYTPIEVPSYKRLLSDFVQQHITISTIGVGAFMINTEFLDWLATGTGGTFYQLNGLEDLPVLIARDTQKAIGRLPFAEGFFRPERAPDSAWFASTPNWPPLKGYITMTAKPGSHVELQITKPGGADPLLAHWSLGLGRVTVFGSDADARWSADWVKWPEFDRVWSEIIRQTMRPRPTEDIFAWVDEHLGAPRLVIEGQAASPAAELVSSDGQTTVPLALVQQSDVRWSAAVDQVPDGWYELLLRTGADASKTADHTASTEGAENDARRAVVRRWVKIGHPVAAIEQPGLPTDEALLRRLAQATGGAYDTPDRAFLPPTERVERAQPIRPWLLPLVIVLLLIDVALRGRTML